MIFAAAKNEQHLEVEALGMSYYTDSHSGINPLAHPAILH